MQQTLLLSFLFIFTFQLSAQRSATIISNGKARPELRAHTSRSIVPDTIFPGIFFDSCASQTLFFPITDEGGYLAGTNEFGDKEKAQFFRFDEVDEFLLTGATVYLAYKDDEVADRFISVKIYDVDPATDGPGNLLATSFSLEVQDLAFDPNGVAGTYFGLGEPLLLENSDFFVSVDFTDIYSSSTGNVSIFTTDFGCGDGFNAWERWEDDSWHAIDEEDGWNEELEFFLGAVIDVDVPSSTKEPLVDLKAQVFPNPAYEFTRLTFERSSSSAVSLTLTNLRGQEVLQKQLGRLGVGRQQTRLELGNLPFGVYTYRLATDAGIQAGRLLVR